MSFCVFFICFKSNADYVYKFYYLKPKSIRSTPNPYHNPPPIPATPQTPPK